MRTRNWNQRRMTLTLDNCYRTNDVKRFLGIFGNLSYDKYPNLVHVAGHGYIGSSIVDAIDTRDNPYRPGPKGSTRVASRWTDGVTGAERAEIRYC